MGGKAIANGEQSKSRRKIGYGKGEIMIISFNSALLGTYKVKTELLDEWKSIQTHFLVMLEWKP